MGDSDVGEKFRRKRAEPIMANLFRPFCKRATKGKFKLNSFVGRWSVADRLSGKSFSELLPAACWIGI